MSKDNQSQSEVSVDNLLKAISSSGKDLTILAPLCGISYTRFYRLAKGVSEPTLSEAMRIYQALGISIPAPLQLNHH